jgi:hypothetical protein
MAKAVKKRKAAPRKPTPKAAASAIAAKRAKAYSDMESHVCDLANMGTIAMDQFDKDKGLFVFAVGKLEDMLNEFRAHYYAEEFPL